jgi:hypothetical protein
LGFISSQFSIELCKEGKQWVPDLLSVTGTETKTHGTAYVKDTDIGNPHDTVS